MQTRIALTAITAGALMFTAACSSGSTHTSSPDATSPPPVAAITTASGGSGSVAPTHAGNMIAAGITVKGSVLTGPNGHTLYYYSKDTPTTVACTASCATAWPPLASPVAAGAGVNAMALGTVTAPDGMKQTTYQGHPLYYYVNDTKAGTALGDGEGGVWHVIPIAASTMPGAPMPGAPMSSSAPGGVSGY